MLALVACAAVAIAPSLWLFLGAHVLVGVAFACLLSGGFAGVAAFDQDERAWAIGYVAGANALAWIVVNPIVGALTEWVSWRVAEAVPAAIAFAALLTVRARRRCLRSRAPRLRGVLADASARRWIGAELIAYGAWTGIAHVHRRVLHRHVRRARGSGRLAARRRRRGVLRRCDAEWRLVARFPRRQLVAVSALAMAALLPLLLGVVELRRGRGRCSSASSA